MNVFNNFYRDFPHSLCSMLLCFPTFLSCREPPERKLYRWHYAFCGKMLACVTHWVTCCCTGRTAHPRLSKMLHHKPLITVKINSNCSCCFNLSVRRFCPPDLSNDITMQPLKTYPGNVIPAQCFSK